MKMKISRLIRNAGVLCIGLMSLPVSTSASSDIVSNEKPDAAKINRARRIIAALQHELEDLSERETVLFWLQSMMRRGIWSQRCPIRLRWTSVPIIMRR